MSELLKRLTDYCRAPPIEKKKQSFNAMVAYHGSRATFRRDYRLYCHFLEKSDGRMSLDDCADLVQEVFLTLTDDSRKDKAGNALPPIIETYDSTRGKFLSWVLGIADKVAAGQWREDQHEEAMLWKYSQDITGEVHSSFKYTHRRDDHGSVITTRNQDGEAVNREMVWNGRRPTEEIALRNFQREINRRKLWAMPALKQLSKREWMVVQQIGQSFDDEERLRDTNRKLARDGLTIFPSLGAYRNAVMRVREKMRSIFPKTSTTGSIQGDHRFNLVPEAPVCPSYAERPDHWLEAYTIPRAHPLWLWGGEALEIAPPQHYSIENYERKPWKKAIWLHWRYGLYEDVHYRWVRGWYEKPTQREPVSFHYSHATNLLSDIGISGTNPKDPSRGGWMRCFAIPRDYPHTYAGYQPTGTAKLKRLEVYRLTGETYELHNVTTTAKYEKGPICD